MILALVLLIIGCILFAVGCSILFTAYDGFEALGGFIAIVIGLVLFFGGAALGNALDNDKKNSIDVCVKKDGQVNQDGLCIVNGKPVEYSKGVWRQ